MAIFKRMEAGVNQAGRELVRSSAAMYRFIRAFDRVEFGEIGLSDLIAGMINLNQGSESVLRGEEFSREGLACAIPDEDEIGQEVTRVREKLVPFEWQLTTAVETRHRDGDSADRTLACFDRLAEMFLEFRRTPPFLKD